MNFHSIGTGYYNELRAKAMCITCAHFKCRHILHNYADKNNRKTIHRIVLRDFLLKFFFFGVFQDISKYTLGVRVYNYKQENYYNDLNSIIKLEVKNKVSLQF